MVNKVCFLMIVIWSTAVAGQSNRIDFKVDTKGGPDLMREREQLQLINEPSVQRESKPRQRTYAFGLSQVSGEYVNVSTDFATMNYEMDEPIAMLRFSYLQLPWEERGQWGWQLSGAYGWRETKRGALKAMLHLIPIDLQFSYRGRLRSSQFIAPQLGIGGGNLLYFQRGGQGLNTSSSEWYGTGSVGLWFGVGEWLSPGSPTPMDLTVSYQRIFSEADAESSWRGDWWSINMGVSL
jgi:hypothetical protein